MKISKYLSLPPVTVTQKLAWLGTTGSGKTYGASKLAELFFSIGAQFVVIDPVGVWYGLRLDEDGKKPSDINIPIFGGLHGDVPLESTGGELMANLVVDKGLSCIIDVSQFESDADKARFAAAFAHRFFFRKKAAPSAIHLFIEECQEFVPQNPQRGEEQMLHAFIRMQKLGRNFGIGSSYISQRPQEVNKKALNMAQTLFVFRTTGTHERNAIEKWIEDKSLDESIAQDLPKIPTGDCHVWSPEFLKISEVIHIAKKETFNASATPEVGTVAKARQLAPIDLEKIRGEMAATIEKAKSEDPKILRRKIAELQNELARKPEPKVVKTGSVRVERIEVPAIGKRTLDGLRKSEKAMRRYVANIQAFHRDVENDVQTFSKGIDRFVSEIAKVSAAKPTLVLAKPIINLSQRQLSIPKKEIVNQSSEEGITGPEQRVLNALAWCESIGNKRPPNELVAFLSGYSHFRSTGYTNPRGYLKGKGLIEYSSGSVYLTEAGRTIAIIPDIPLTQGALHQTVLNKLDGPERKLLMPLLERYPEGISNTELCSLAGYMHERSTGYTNPRGRLKSFGLIEYSPGGMVEASSILFIQ